MIEADLTKVAVIFGGRSSEHSISCLSAASVLAALDRGRYAVSAIGIAKNGQWFRVSDDHKDWARRGNELPQIPTVGSPISIADLDADVVFPVMHGRFGEDGTMQGALEIAGVPYVGSGVLASAATMDKQATKVLLAGAGLPVGNYVAISDSRWVRARDEVIEQISTLRYPLFVKPARAGSSVGISKVSAPGALIAAIDAARVHDRKLIVEESIEGAREIECGVLAGFGYDPPQASICAEITVRGDHEFYDFAAKYLDGSAELTVPAALPEAVHKELGDLAITAFEALGCDGLARVDFFLDSAGGVVINEVNTMPGFTEISLFPRMWQAMGFSYPRLVDHLVSVALEGSPTALA